MIYQTAMEWVFFMLGGMVIFYTGAWVASPPTSQANIFAGRMALIALISMFIAFCLYGSAK